MSIRKFQTGGISIAPNQTNIKLLATNLSPISMQPKALEIPNLSTLKQKSTSSDNTTMKGFFSNLNGNSAGMLGGLLGTTGAHFNNDLDQNVLNTRESLRGAISSLGPIGAIIGAATGVVDMIGDTTGLGLNSLDNNAADRADLGTARVANNALATLPGVGLFAGLAGGETAAGNKSEFVDQYRNTYSGTAADIDASTKLGEQRILFGKNKTNDFINTQNTRNAQIAKIGEQNNLRKSSTYGEELSSQNLNKYWGRLAGTNIRAGKQGMKLPLLEEARLILKTLSTTVSEIAKFADGGKMNVIAQGALHSRNNNLEEINANLSEVTTKGIPVISVDEGEVIQHAEIEGGELVLTKEITSKLEALYKDGSEEAMIEAGKLLTEELIDNTDDKTNEILEDGDKD